MNLPKNQIICGDNLKVIASWPSNSVSSIVTDPPYGIGFMGKEWDNFKPGYRADNWTGYENQPKTTPGMHTGKYDLSRNAEYQEWFRVLSVEFLRITKPGGFLLCFGGTRTYHRLTCAIEDAGWEIRDCMMWLYGSGFPKSTNISLQFDKTACRKQLEKRLGRKPTKEEMKKAWEGFREVVGDKGYTSQDMRGNAYDSDKAKERERLPAKITAPTIPLAQFWDGYGTALKPAWEPVIVAMKPLDGTFAHNAEKHGVAGLNIDGCRISTSEKLTFKFTENMGSGNSFKMAESTDKKRAGQTWENTKGRWPANLILDEESGGLLGEPSRFFYCAKTSRKERNMGMEDCEDKLLARSGGAQGAENRGEKEYLQKHIGLNRVAVVKNNHPTVKPLALMKYLCTLLKMPSADQIIVDPFLGSGTTGIACKELGINFIGIEKEQEYCEIAVKRIAAVPGKEIILHTETTLPITKNVETFRTATDFAGGSRRPNENLPRISEHRQSIINAAAAKLRSQK